MRKLPISNCMAFAWPIGSASDAAPGNPISSVFAGACAAKHLPGVARLDTAEINPLFDKMKMHSIVIAPRGAFHLLDRSGWIH